MRPSTTVHGAPAPSFLRSRKALALVAASMLALSACADSEREEPAASESGGESEAGGGTFVFAGSSDPVVLDPAFTSEGETFRITRQIFEGLVGTKPGTADPAPLLAESWTSSEDGLSYTFLLKEGVKFHDDTDFDAEAVCANFDRWYNWTGLQQSPNITAYYSDVFQGFKTNEDPAQGEALYQSCEPVSPTEVTINLTRPFAAFPQALSLPSFAMQSPTAMEEHDADNVSGTEDDVRFSAYGTEHPTGTGPFVFESWDRGEQVTLARNEGYWGEKAKLDTVIIQTIADPNARLQALRNGDIDGYDLVAPGDLEGLESDGFQIESRAAFNVMYLGFNQAYTAPDGTKPLADLRVRQAIAHAIDREAVISQSLPEGTTPATQFMPDLVEGYADDVPTYDYDPDAAKALLAEAGVPNLTLQFNYPTGVSRPYMPSPEDTYVALSAQLEAVGITVEPVADQWTPDYLDKMQGTADHGVHLLGWTGDYNDPGNFVGVFFGREKPEWGFTNPELFAALDAASQLPTQDEQAPLYQDINRQIMEYLPGVPIAHPVPSLAFAPGVEGYSPSPVQDEVWNEVTVSES